MGVPYLEKNQPRPAGVRSYPWQEAYGLVLVFPGSVSRVEEVGFPNVSLEGGIRTVFLELGERPHAVEVHYTFSQLKSAQPLGEKLIPGSTKSSADCPKHDLMIICTNYPYQTLQFSKAGSTEPAR